MSGVRRVWRWAPPYLAWSGAALPLAAVAAAWAGWFVLAAVLAIVAAACPIALHKALRQWKRSAMIERSVRAQPVRRQGVSSAGWGPPIWRRAP